MLRIHTTAGYRYSDTWAMTDMKRFFLAFCLALAPHAAVAKNSVIQSPHNLSASGPGLLKSLNTRQVCVFCHAPHSVSPNSPLWNRADTGQTYTQYSSSTLSADPGQPSGSSRLCLACHDGTVALERMNTLPAGVSDVALSKRVEGRSNLGTDLADDHPISFAYDSTLASRNPDLAHPSTVDLPMDNGMMRCGTCHDPHDSTYPPFLNETSDRGQICTTCHVITGSDWSWQSSSHATAEVRPQGAKPWAERKPQWRGQTVADNACYNCHAPHNAATPSRLITDLEENTCYRCHDGSVAKTDIRSEMLKPSSHPVGITPNRDHDADKAEDPLRMRLHVECEDCHNPHSTSEDLPMVTVNPNEPAGGSQLTRAPFVNDTIRGVRGLSAGGFVKDEADAQYETCFKCHGVPGKSACGRSRCSTARSMRHERVDRTYNLRDKVDPDSNAQLESYHPIVRNNPFNNDSNQSLRQELGLYAANTLIYCTDCHNSDRSSAGKGTGPEGPHGSIYPPLLSNRYSLNPTNFGSSRAEAELCFKCHDESVLRSPQSDSGILHNSHREHGTCVTCHDPHGSARYPHLINFETRNNLAPAGSSASVIGAGPFAEPTWLQDKTCWLRCHSGEPHLGWNYLSRETEEEGSEAMRLRFGVGN